MPPAACCSSGAKPAPSRTKDGCFRACVASQLSVRAAQTAISKLAATVGVEGVSSHSFRRSVLTAAHQSGLSLREVATISGHASLAALERYLDQDAAREKADGARGLLLASVDV
jgi:integrase